MRNAAVLYETQQDDPWKYENPVFCRHREFMCLGDFCNDPFLHF